MGCATSIVAAPIKSNGQHMASINQPGSAPISVWKEDTSPIANGLQKERDADIFFSTSPGKQEKGALLSPSVGTSSPSHNMTNSIQGPGKSPLRIEKGDSLKDRSVQDSTTHSGENNVLPDHSHARKPTYSEQLKSESLVHLSSTYDGAAARNDEWKISDGGETLHASGVLSITTKDMQNAPDDGRPDRILENESRDGAQTSQTQPLLSYDIFAKKCSVDDLANKRPYSIKTTNSEVKPHQDPHSLSLSSSFDFTRRSRAFGTVPASLESKSRSQNGSFFKTMLVSKTTCPPKKILEVDTYCLKGQSLVQMTYSENKTIGLIAANGNVLTCHPLDGKCSNGFSIASKLSTVRNACLSPDGKFIAVVGDSHSTSTESAEESKAQVILICKLEDGSCSKTVYIQGNATCSSLSWSPCGTQLIGGLSDGRFCAYKSSNGEWAFDEAFSEAAGSQGNYVITMIKFHASGRHVVYSAANGCVGKLDTDCHNQYNKGTQVTVKRHTGAATCIALARNGHMMASGGEDCSVRVSMFANFCGEEIQCLEGHTKTISGVAFGDNGLTLVSSSGSNTRVWDPMSGTLLFNTDFHKMPIIGVSFVSAITDCNSSELVSARSSSRFITVGKDGKVVLWDSDDDDVDMTTTW